MPEDVLRPALKELEDMLDAALARKWTVSETASETVELGVAFQPAFAFDGTQRFEVHRPVSEAPLTLALMASAMEAVRQEAVGAAAAGAEGHALLEEVSKPSALDDPLLNIIVRRYWPGQKLGFHKDAIGLFTADIWGCVLLADPDSVGFLSFRPPPTQTVKKGEYAVPERDGVAFCQTGESRYTWLHGLEAAPYPWWASGYSAAFSDGGDARRVSITWRWFRPEALQWSKSSWREHRLWIAAFTALLLHSFGVVVGNSKPDGNAKAEEIDEALVDFLAGWSQPLPRGCRRLFAGKNDACGPQVCNIDEARKSVSYAREEFLEDMLKPEENERTPQLLQSKPHASVEAEERQSKVVKLRPRPQLKAEEQKTQSQRPHPVTKLASEEISQQLLQKQQPTEDDSSQSVPLRERPLELQAFLKELEVQKWLVQQQQALLDHQQALLQLAFRGNDGQQSLGNEKSLASQGPVLNGSVTVDCSREVSSLLGFVHGNEEIPPLQRDKLQEQPPTERQGEDLQPVNEKDEVQPVENEHLQTQLHKQLQEQDVTDVWSPPSPPAADETTSAVVANGAAHGPPSASAADETTSAVVADGAALGAPSRKCRYVMLGLPQLEDLARDCIAAARPWWRQQQKLPPEAAELHGASQAVGHCCSEPRVRALLALQRLWAAVGCKVKEAKLEEPPKLVLKPRVAGLKRKWGGDD